MNYTGCKSCFACKKLGGESYGECIIKDDIHKFLEKVSQAEGIIFDSPTYFSNITGQLQSFLERLLFPYLVYDKESSSIALKKMPIGFIHTMNTSEEFMEEFRVLSNFAHVEGYLERIFTKPLVMYSNNTYQFDNYYKYKSDVFSEEEKSNHRKTQFLLDCQKAFELGLNLIK